VRGIQEVTWSPFVSAVADIVGSFTQRAAELIRWVT
jgi:hypothetical protein